MQVKKKIMRQGKEWEKSVRHIKVSGFAQINSLVHSGFHRKIICMKSQYPLMIAYHVNNILQYVHVSLSGSDCVTAPKEPQHRNRVWSHAT